MTGDRAIIARDGDVWTIEFGGTVRHLPKLKGLEYLSRLLERPGQPIPALALEERSVEGPVSRERARVNVTRAIRSVMHRLDHLHPSLADHLRATLRTGRDCCYRPDPRVPIRWRTENDDGGRGEEC